MVVAATIMGFVLYTASKLVISNLLMVFVMIGVGMVVYFGVMFALGRKQIIADTKTIIASLKK